ncbi:hypothetical protein [Colwellia ponticola]|uniref:hypothetical protein n=1 Tax=Colwellia ponticola TaxID=2304625 RepID=UPI00148752C7|nr:hypothetical protein [Colwellia ponticola]
MWQVNETIAFDGKSYRVLFIENSYFYWFAIDDNKGFPEIAYSHDFDHRFSSALIT